MSPILFSCLSPGRGLARAWRREEPHLLYLALGDGPQRALDHEVQPPFQRPAGLLVRRLHAEHTLLQGTGLCPRQTALEQVRIQLLVLF